MTMVKDDKFEIDTAELSTDTFLMDNNVDDDASMSNFIADLNRKRQLSCSDNLNVFKAEEPASKRKYEPPLVDSYDALIDANAVNDKIDVKMEFKNSVEDLENNSPRVNVSENKKIKHIFEVLIYNAHRSNPSMYSLPSTISESLRITH